MGGCLSNLNENLGANNFTSPQPGQGYAETLFFPDGLMPCRNYMRGDCKRSNCKYAHTETNLVKLLRHLERATKTVDLAVFSITCDDIADTLIELHKRGVRVRIITDDAQSVQTGSDAARLAHHGIQLVQDNSPFHMHHKFCVIDGRMLINGSLNWTVQGVKSNEENVMILDDPRFVQAFETQFEQMWRKFAGNHFRG